MKVSSFQGFVEKIASSGPGALFLACGTGLCSSEG